MNKHLVATNSDGVAVYVNLVASAAGKQIGAAPHLLTLAQEIITHKSFTGKNFVIETHMGRLVGTNAVVKTSEKDVIFYAKPVGSQSYRRYVKNHSYTPTRYLTLALHLDDDGTFELTDICVGRSRPATPSETQATVDEQTSRDFWDNHAYIWEPKACQSQSITKDCPWASSSATNSPAEVTS